MYGLHILKFLGLSLSVLLLMTTSSFADGKVNCDAYAKLTVKQAKKAKQRGCGFSGPVWSKEYSFHKNWCLRSDVHMADLTRENNNRLGALKKCKNESSKKKFECDAYAKLTVKQAKEAKQRGCGFSGPVWSMVYNFHKKWCLRSDVHMADRTRENNNRLGAIQKCKDKIHKKDEARRAKQKKCLKFAKKAQKLREEVNSACPSDGEWPVPLKQDVDHCMKKGGRSYVRMENLARIGKIGGCMHEVGKAKLNQTKTFPHSGKMGTRRKQWLPVDVCLRKYYKDGSWVFGLGGGITDVPPSWGCGKSVADAFCITKGYVEAIKYPIETYDNGSNMDGRFASTYWIGSKKACHGKCGGFSSITCKGKL